MSTANVQVEHGELASRSFAASACVILAAASMLLGAIFVAVTPPGQPRDEPAYFRTVEYYGEHGSMPRLGKPGVTYEAQMGPVYYTLTAPVYRAVDAVASERSAFYAVRSEGLLLLWPLVFLTFALCSELGVGTRTGVLASGIVGLHPSIVAVAGTVQNDILAAVLAVWVLVRFARALAAANTRLSEAVVVGVITSAAVLTKHTTLFLVPAIMLTGLVTGGRRWLGWIGAFLATVAAGTGWLFVRNIVLYGDLTGRKGVEAGGDVFLTGRLHGIGDIVDWGRVIASHFTIPYEYYFNKFEPPAWVRAVVALIVAIAAAGLVRALARCVRSGSLGAVTWRRPQVVATALATGILLVGYTIVYWTFQSLAPRILFAVFPVFAVIFAIAIQGLYPTRASRSMVVGCLTLALLVAADAYVLRELAQIQQSTFLPIG